MKPDGTYEKINRRGKDPVGAQIAFCRKAKAIAGEKTEGEDPRIFVPETHEG